MQSKQYYGYVNVECYVEISDLQEKFFDENN